MHYNCITMAMATSQVRLTKELTKAIDGLVKKGLYATKSDAIRDAVRRFVWEKEVGTIPNTGDSVKEIREIRKKLSKQPFDLDEINSLGK